MRKLRIAKAVLAVVAVLVLAALWITLSIKRETLVDLRSGRVRSHVRLWTWTFSEQESTSRFTDWATGVGIAFDTPRWELRSSKGVLDHSGPQMFGGRADSFLDSLALCAELAKLDKGQARDAIESGLKLVEQSGPGKLVGDVTVRDGIVIVSNPDRAVVWQSR
jgi:hypothetical protein